MKPKLRIFKSYIIYIIISLSFATSVCGVNLYSLDKRWIIKKQSYFQGYIDYDFEIINHYTTKVTWKLKDQLMFNITMECISKYDDKCVSDYADQYKNQIKDYEKNKINFLGIGSLYTVDEFKKSYFNDVKDKNKLIVDSAKVRDYGFPINIIKGDVAIIGTIEPKKQTGGEFYIHTSKPFDEMESAEIEIGYGTIIIELSNGLESELLNHSAWPYYKINKITRYIKLPLFSELVTASLNFTGEYGENSKFDKLDYFDDGSINSSMWKYGLDTYGSITETGTNESTSYLRLLNFIADGGTYNSSLYNHHFDLRNSSLIMDMNWSYIDGGCDNGQGTGYYQIYVTDYTTNVLLLSAAPLACNYTQPRISNILFHNKTINNITLFRPGGTLNKTVSVASLDSSKEWNLYIHIYGQSLIPYYDIGELRIFMTGQQSDAVHPDNYMNDEYPFNLTLSIGGNESYVNESNFAGNISLDITTVINNSMSDNSCNCSGCIRTPSSCFVPLTTTLERGGLINITALRIETNITTGTVRYNFHIRNELTGDLITENVKLVFDSALFQNTSYTNQGKMDYLAPVGNYSLFASSPDTSETEVYQLSKYFFNVDRDFNRTIYLLNDTTDTDYIEIFLQDKGLNPIRIAQLDFYRKVNGSYRLVRQAKTDGFGYTQVFLDQTAEYIINISHPSFDTQSLTLQPFKSEYFLTIAEAGGDIYDSNYKGIVYSISPINRSLQITNDWTNFSLDIHSSLSDLEYYGLEVKGHNYECYPASCKSNITGASGGIATVSVRGNTTGKVQIDFFFKRSGRELQYINAKWYDFADLIESLINIQIQFKNLKEQLGGEAIVSFASTFVISGVAVAGAQMGIIGFPILLLIGMATIFFMAVGFINPVIGIFMILFGTFIYIFLARPD